jgi:hypothetical protein
MLLDATSIDALCQECFAPIASVTTGRGILIIGDLISFHFFNLPTRRVRMYEIKKHTLACKKKIDLFSTKRQVHRVLTYCLLFTRPSVEL